MLKTLGFVGLMAIGLGHALPAHAQHDYGWTRLVNAAWTEEKGPASGQCIDVPRESKQVGTPLSMHGCHNGENQRFRLMDGNFDNSRIAVYSGANERCIGFDPATGVVNITHCATAPRWRTGPTIATPDGKSCLRVQSSGDIALVVSCNPLAPDPKTIFGSNWHMSTLGTPYGNIVAVVNEQSFNCIDVRGESTAPGSSLIHYWCTGNDNQTIQVRGTAEQVYFTVYADGQMLCLSNVADGGNPRSTQAVPCNRWDPRQAWNLRTGSFPSPGFRLRNAKTGRCLDAFVHSGDVGSWETCHDNRNQAWLFLRG